MDAREKGQFEARRKRADARLQRIFREQQAIAYEMGFYIERDRDQVILKPRKPHDP